MTGATEEPFTTAGVGGALTALSFGKCSLEGVKVDKAGSFNIEHIASTTNGTLRSVGTEVTVPSPIGLLNCKTGTGAHIGTLTGSATGNATLDINAVINCGILAPSAVWAAEYTVTSPTKLGVSS